jgi:CRP/FNR family cyclic AMP-dependent transcriptional regulator
LRSPSLKLNVEQKVDFLKAVPLFSRLNPSQIQEIAQLTTSVSFGVNSYLFNEGTVGEAMYLIVNGTVRIERATQAGGTFPIGVSRRGDYIGELSLIDGGDRMADAIAITHCDALMLRRDVFESLLFKQPSFALSIMVGLAERIRSAASHAENLTEQSVSQRLADALYAYAEADGIKNPNGHIQIPRVTHESLGEQVSAQRSTVSRALKEMVTSKIISYDGRKIVVVNLARLKKRAGLTH